MAKKNEWTKAVVGGYGTAILLYAPISIVGYIVYGSFLGRSDVSTILDAIIFFDSSTAVILKVCSGIMIAHILSAFPIVINPVFLAVRIYVDYLSLSI
jgi:hypothetical protein